jgi:microcompartment protein CcmK/EutM
VQDLSAAGQNAFSPQVALNGNGNGLEVWTRFNGLCQCDKTQARPVSSAGVLGSVQDLSAGGQNAESPQVAIDAGGNALAVWQRFDGTNDRVQARTRSAAGVLGAVQTLSDAGQNAFSPQVAIDAAGAGITVWTRYDGTNDRVQARTLSTSGVLGSVQTLSDALQDAEEPQVAIDAGGNALAVWERFDGANFLIQARTRSAVGVLGSVLTLSAAGQTAFSSQVAVNGNGNGLVDWTRFNGLCQCDKTQVRPVSSAGVLGSVQDLSAGGQNAESPQVGIDASGKGVAVWTSFSGGSSKIQARTRSASGVLGKVQTLSTSGDAFSPQVAVNGAGTALADWTRVGFVDRTQAAVGP